MNSSDFLEGLPKVNLQLDSSQYVSVLLGPSLELLKQLSPNIAADALQEIGEKMGALLKDMFLKVFPNVFTDLNDKVVKMLAPTVQLLLKDERLVILGQLDAILSTKLIASI